MLREVLFLMLTLLTWLLDQHTGSQSQKNAEAMKSALNDPFPSPF